MKKLLYLLIIMSSVYSVYAQVPAASNTTGAADTHKNWIISKTFDENGNAITESKQFFDNNGKAIQSQSKVKYRKDASTVYTHVFASQSIRDAYGREVATTLAAPINASQFKYDSSFVRTTGGGIYDYRNFDRYNPSGTETNKTDAPDGVGTSTSGTLGWYYSANNTWEPYTPTTDYPYSRQVFYRDGTNNVKKSAGAGETFKSGSGHEAMSFVTPVINELDDYVAVRNKYFTSAGELPTTLKYKAIQTIGRDANGREAVLIQDKDGKTLMVGRPGSELAVSNTATLDVPYSYFFKGTDIGTNAKNLKISNGNIKIYESQNSGSSYSQIYSGHVSGYTSPSSLAYWYKIESDSAFTVNYDAAISGQPDYTVCKNCPCQINGTSMVYFKLFASGTVTITGSTSFDLYDMSTEQTVSFTSGNSLTAGYYKLVNKGNVSLSLAYSNGYADVRYSFYNQLGQLIATIAPEGVKKLYGSGINSYAAKTDVPFITLNEYDVQGRLINSKNPDATDKGKLVYRKDGNIRFSQNAQQATTGRYSYTNYDALGRPIESGEYQPDGSGIAFNDDLTAGSNPMRDILENTTAGGGLTSGTRKDVIVTTYDVTDNSHGQSGYTQDAYYMRGAVSLTQKYSSVSGNPPYSSTYLISATWYSYDEEGKVTWMIKYVNGLGYKTTDYTYSTLGQLTKRVFQKNTSAETFVHYYEYDPANLQLWKVYTNTTDNYSTKMLQASYVYYLHGPLKRVELATDLQGIDYTYTLQGALKAINNSNSGADPGGDGSTFKTDAFGMVLDYYPDDYKNTRSSGIVALKGVNTSSIVSTESYAGNIKAMSWFSKKPASVLSGNPNAENPTTYVYNYDDKYQFLESTWGTGLNFSNTPASFTSTNYNKELVKHPTNGTPGYDANGNILYLQRRSTSGTLTDKFIYNYGTNTNKLTSVVNDASGSSVTYANYAYDNLGQLTAESSTASSTDKYIQYDVTGKVVAVYRDASKTQKVVEYVYDEMGQRVIKRSYNTSYQLVQNTYYLGDVVYTQPVSGGTPGTIVVQEYELDGGSGRVGVYYRPVNVYAYQMCDHLGNVRAVIAKSGSNLEIRMYTDYYPYGMVIQQGGSNDYRYEYQGNYAEKDKETDWNAFELRMYDSRIARWLSVDPYGQFSSPYVSMGNDPIAGVDPDGGFKTWFGAWLNKTWYGGDYIGKDKNSKEWFVGQKIDYTGPGVGVAMLRRFNNDNRNKQAAMDDLADRVSRDFVLRHDLKAFYNNQATFVPNFRPGMQLMHVGGGNYIAGWNEALQRPLIDPIDFVAVGLYGVAKGLGGAAAKTGGTTVFRAVDATEASIVNSTGRFSLQEGGVEMKYFAKSLEDAHWYGQRLYPDGYSIIQATVKKHVDVTQYWFPHVDIGAYVFPKQTLPYITPH